LPINVRDAVARHPAADEREPGAETHRPLQDDGGHLPLAASRPATASVAGESNV